MGQKTNPIGLRLGIIRQWDANWFDEKNVAAKIGEDMKVRDYIKKRLKKILKITFSILTKIVLQDFLVYFRMLRN